MLFTKKAPLSSILDKSPFFNELTFKEKETLIRELVKTYPQYFRHIQDETDIGYESGRYAGKSY